MARKRKDWETLEPALRMLKKDALLQVLREARQAMPSSRVVSVFGAFVDLTTHDTPPPIGKRTAPRRLLEAL
jgi:hypothetical protein